MGKWFFKALVFLGLYMLVYSFYAVQKIDSNTLQLKNAFEELQAKHNKLVTVVRYIDERGTHADIQKCK